MYAVEHNYEYWSDKEDAETLSIIVGNLLKHGANISAKDGEGSTAMGYTVAENIENIENICMTHLLFIQVSDLWRVALLTLLSSRYVQQGKYYTNSTP